MISRSNKNRIKKTAGNNGEQACRKGNAGAFSNITELAHNICSMIVERFRNLKDKIKEIVRSAISMDYGSFSNSQILINWSRVRVVLHAC